MKFLSDPRCALILALVFVGLATTQPASAQYAERPWLVNSFNEEVDASGRSVKNPRVRAIHTTDPALQGGTAFFFAKDPFLAYQLGRNLNFREFRERDGVFSRFHANEYGYEVGGVGDLGGPMQNQIVDKLTLFNQVSCSACHNIPYGTPGGAVSFAKDAGLGRQSPHYFGAGLMEMIAIQIRTDLLLQLDLNGDSWVDYAEAEAAPDPIFVAATPDGPLINFGSAKIDPATNEPGLNQILKIFWGCSGLTYIPGAETYGQYGADRYSFHHTVFGWGQLQPENALNPTTRTFMWDPLNAHSGIEAFDPSTMDDPDLNGVSEPTLAGAIQFPVTHLPPDRGFYMDPLGFSLDDNDEDGHMTEFSEGDLDLAEWFMLNSPRPTFAARNADYLDGLGLMDSMGCTTCHVADWEIAKKDRNGHPGDRRFFDLNVEYTPQGTLEAELVKLYNQRGDSYILKHDEFLVEGIFTDFLHHDMGYDFQEMGYDGNVQTMWRTAPLWGVGSGFPWGHDGQSLTLKDVILRHSGEGATSRDAFIAANEDDQDRLIDFLRKLQLYDIENMPTDLDGDGVISENFIVAGVDTGIERFNAEWLFRRPVQIQGMVTPKHSTYQIRSFAAVNRGSAYGLGLAYRKDTDLDGWPDVWDAAPTVPGYKDGVNK